MKSFLALILFASFFVGLHANHLNDYLFDVEADGEIPDRHPIAVSMSSRSENFLPEEANV